MRPSTSPMLSSPLAVCSRRGWGRLYAALDRGRTDAEALRRLLARHLLTAGSGTTPVFAVDVSVWPRCDAESSPLLKASTTILLATPPEWPIVTGWAYQFIAKLNFVRESWTAPVDALRVRPAEDANVVATEQVKALLGRLGMGETDPLFVFDAGTIPSRCSRGSSDGRTRSSSV